MSTNAMRLEDNETRNRVRSVFIEATSDNPNMTPTVLFNVGEGTISHLEITSRPGETARCRIYMRDRRSGQEGGDNYYLDGIRAETFLEGLRRTGAWPMAAETARHAGSR